MIFTCKDNFEDILTCIYDAWEWALKNGHENVKFEKEPLEQLSFIEEYTHIEANNEKVTKVIRSIKNKISYNAYTFVYYASLSKEKDAVQVIYDFLRIGFKSGAVVLNMLTEPAVMRMTEIRRNISNEICHFTEFVRFNSINNEIYVSHIEPKSNIVYPVSQNFADRMPSENWMIIDDNRKIAVIHPKNEKMYMQHLSEEVYNELSRTEEYRDEFDEMWKTFFKTIAIEKRNNYKCQLSHFPKWKRKHVTEYM